MSSTGTPTSNLGLNQWVPNDKPERVDFNRDNQKIEASMDNKVTLRKLDYVDDFDEIKTTTIFDSNTASVNGPDNGTYNNYGTFFCIGGRVPIQIGYLWNDPKKRLMFRFKSDSYGKSWTQLATAEPPTEYDLPLASGYTSGGKSTYYKDQFGSVTINFEISKSGTSDDLKEELIATLPAGFRPSSVVKFAVAGFRVDTARKAAIGIVYPDGRIYLSIGSIDAMKAATGCVTFLAST